MDQNEILNLLKKLYDKAVDGAGFISPSVEDFARDYLSKHPSVDSAARAMLKAQVTKCTTSGFVTGFGGLVTLPVTVPANVSSVLYVQMRMIACAAYMGGYDIKSDQVQTFVFACLAGVSVNEVVKKIGVDLANKAAMNAIKKIPGKVTAKINQKVGFRFITKMGTKGVVNLWRIVPVAGAVVNGGLDYAETRIIANRAYKMFIQGDFSVGETDEAYEDIIYVDP